MAQVILYPGWTVFDENGNPAAGAKARFFTAGTSTPVNVFSDSTLVTPHAVPVVADSEGRFPTIYAASGEYKIKVTDSLDVDLFPEVDNWTILTDLTTTQLSFPTVTKTTNYTVVEADRGKVLEFDAAGSTLIVTLKAATLGAGFPIWIVNSGATGTVQLEFDPGETLLDLTSYTLTDKHQAVGITSRGASGWRLFSAVTLERMTTIASAATITLGDGGYFEVTGTATIIDIDFTNDIAGHSAWVKFTGILQLTHSATLILPASANTTTAAGDTALFVSEGSDVVRCISYNRVSGTNIIIDVQTFSTAGADTWEKPTGGQAMCMIEIWGGGGSGGKGRSLSGAGGGGGGQYVRKFFALTALGATEPLSIGAGGVAQTTGDSNGNVGGNSTFGAAATLVTAYGGGPGMGTETTGINGGGHGGGPNSAGGTNTLQGNTTYSFANFAHDYVNEGVGGRAGAVASVPGENGRSTTFNGAGGGAAAFEGNVVSNGAGGNSTYGGAGGGAGAEDVGPGPGAGGTSQFGGAGGAGAYDADAATAGTQPAGGGGGSETGTSGAGGNGKAIVTCW